jgi:hypothetical protein
LRNEEDRERARRNLNPRPLDSRKDRDILETPHLRHKANSSKGEASFRFYEELNEYLPETEWKKEMSFRFNGSVMIRKAIESFGIRTDDVDLVLVNGVSVDFSHSLKDGDRVSVYPIFERFDISGITRVRDRPLNKIRSRPESKSSGNLER